MGMQTDVVSATVNSTGFLFKGRQRIKGVIATGTNSSAASLVIMYDTAASPTAVTYGRSGTTITVAHNNHGLSVGQNVGLYFVAGTGGQATAGNYRVATVSNVNAYTVTDFNSGSITAGATAIEAPRFLSTFSIPAGSNVFMPLPGQGMLAENGAYVGLADAQITVFYG